MKKQLIFTALLLLILLYIIYNFLHKEREKDIGNIMYKSLQMIEISYSSVLNTYKISAQKDMNYLLKNSAIMELLKEFKYASNSQKNLLRGRIYRQLYKQYNEMKKINIRQFHFHTHNGKSLLRFHKPHRSGDSLLRIRKSIRVANIDKEKISGFEGGKIYPGFRYVFPIFYNKEHLGSVEFSIAFESIEKELNEVLPLLGYQLIISKEESYDKVFEWHKDYFIKTALLANYYIENPKISFVTKKLQNSPIAKELECSIQKHRELIDNQIKAGESFSIPLTMNQRGYMIHFLDIKNTENIHAGYIVAYSSFDELIDINNRYRVFFILLYTGIILIFFLTWIVSKQFQRLSFQTENLQHLLNEQENIVLLSSGERLTYANQKFFDFFNLENLDDFLEEYQCVCQKFIEDDRFFHLGKIKDTRDWVEVVRELPKSESIVAMMNQNQQIHLFSLSINLYQNDIYILSFSDISATMIEQMQLREKTLHDTLTHTYNREYFKQNIQQIIIDYTKSGNRLALCMLDIDFFKNVNDTYGHDIGDKVLIELVKMINKFSRRDDILIRWGGEEFIIILKIHSLDGLTLALENLRKSIAKHQFSIDKNITCSLGGSIYIQGETITSTIKRADKALYNAKDNGRNRVVIL